MITFLYECKRIVHGRKEAGILKVGQESLIIILVKLLFTEHKKVGLSPPVCFSLQGFTSPLPVDTKFKHTTNFFLGVAGIGVKSKIYVKQAKRRESKAARYHLLI